MKDNKKLKELFIMFNNAIEEILKYWEGIDEKERKDMEAEIADTIESLDIERLRKDFPNVLKAGYIMLFTIDKGVERLKEEA